MTNAMIILLERVELMKQGKIGSTGRIAIVMDADGNEKQIEEPEEIHTYQKWKSMGYQVQKGEKAVASFPIWKHVQKKPENEGDAPIERMFLKTSAFFTMSQVEKITA